MGKKIRESSGSYGLNYFSRTNNSDQEIGNHQQHKDGKKQVAQSITLKPGTKELDLGKITMPFSQRP